MYQLFSVLLLLYCFVNGRKYVRLLFLTFYFTIELFYFYIMYFLRYIYILHNIYCKIKKRQNQRTIECISVKRYILVTITLASVYSWYERWSQFYLQVCTLWQSQDLRSCVTVRQLAWLRTTEGRWWCAAGLTLVEIIVLILVNLPSSGR